MNIDIYCESLADKTVLITGGAGGIGAQTALYFAKMGAKVIIIDIDKENGLASEKRINHIVPNSTVFYHMDISKAESFPVMKEYVINHYGCPNIIFNNAAILHLGDIGTVSSDDWDNGYRVNLKAPILFADSFIVEMKKRGSGIIVCVSSSGAAAHMGAYEIFKTAQAELAATLSLELEENNIYSYTISPGLVKTNTAMRSIEVVASAMNISTDSFYEMNKDHIVSIEDAAAGFALSVLKAKEYNGQELGSIQVLNDFSSEKMNFDKKLYDKTLVNSICSVFTEQHEGWKARNIFERQWTLRDFKKTVGKSADEVSQQIKTISEQNGELTDSDLELFRHLKQYWEHQYQLLQGFEKDPIKLNEHNKVIKQWILNLENILQ